MNYRSKDTTILLKSGWEITIRYGDYFWDTDYRYDPDTGEEVRFSFPYHASIDPDGCMNSSTGKMGYAYIDFYNGEIDSIRIDWMEGEETVSEDFYPEEILYTNWEYFEEEV